MIGLEIGVLIIAAVLSAHVLIKAPIRREILAHQVLAVVALAIVLTGVAGLVHLSLRVNAVRHTSVGLVALAAILALWRARPQYGCQRGLPPGSLGLAASLDAIDDPTFYAQATKRWGTVFKMSQVHRPVACIADIAVAQDLFRSQEDALTQSQWSFNRLVPGGYLEYMRGEPHARYRALLSAALAPATIEASRAVMRSVATHHLMELSAASRTAGVNPEPFLLPVAMSSLLFAVLGVAPAHERSASLEALFTDLARPMELYLPVPRRMRATYQALLTEVRALGNASGAADRLPPLSVLAELLQQEPAALNDETLAGNLILMVKEGSIMVRGLLRWVLKMLCDHPEWAERLREASGDSARFGTLARHFVLETLRLHESRYVYRVATRDLSVGPFRIPRGWLVRLCLGEAHERKDRFVEPHTFNPQRFATRAPGSDHFAPFGHGRHACLGADLTLAIAQEFLHEAVLHFDVSTVADGPPWRINRHWGLWRPSQQWRVASVPRTPART